MSSLKCCVKHEIMREEESRLENVATIMMIVRHLCSSLTINDCFEATSQFREMLSLSPPIAHQREIKLSFYSLTPLTLDGDIVFRFLFLAVFHHFCENCKIIRFHIILLLCLRHSPCQLRRLQKYVRIFPTVNNAFLLILAY